MASKCKPVAVIREMIRKFLVALKRKPQNIPLVATNEAFYDKPEMYEAHDALLCIGHKTYVDEVNRLRLSPEHYLKTPEQMIELFADLPEAISNTVQIAKRCGYFVEFHQPEFPRYDCHGKTEDEVLKELSETGLKKRMKNRPDEFEKYNARYFSNEVPRLLFDCGGLHSMVESAWHSGRPRSWFGGRVRCGLGVDDYGY